MRKRKKSNNVSSSDNEEERFQCLEDGSSSYDERIRENDTNNMDMDVGDFGMGIKDI